eukprot:12625640-Alexandrium_andersonii.AAC.1
MRPLLWLFASGLGPTEVRGRRRPAGWGVAAVVPTPESPEGALTNRLVGPVVTDPRLPTFIGIARLSAEAAELTACFEALYWA